MTARKAKIFISVASALTILASITPLGWAGGSEAIEFNKIKQKFPTVINTAAEFDTNEKTNTLKRFFTGPLKDKVTFNRIEAERKTEVSLTSDPTNKFDVLDDSFQVKSDMVTVAAQYIRSSLFDNEAAYRQYIANYIKNVTGSTTPVGNINIPKTSNALALVYKVGSFGVPGKNPVNYIDFGQPAGKGAPANLPVQPADNSVMTFGTSATGNFAMNFLSSNGFTNQYAYVVAYVGDGNQDDIKTFTSGRPITVQTLLPDVNKTSQVIPTEYTGVPELIGFSFAPQAGADGQYIKVKPVAAEQSKIHTDGTIADVNKVLLSYDIKAYNSNDELANLPGNVTISIPLSEAAMSKYNTLKGTHRFILYHVKDDNTKSKLNHTISGNMLTFTTSNFSEFALVAKYKSSSSSSSSHSEPADSANTNVNETPSQEDTQSSQLTQKIKTPDTGIAK